MFDITNIIVGDEIPEVIAKTIRTSILDTGTFSAKIGDVQISIHSDGTW